MKQVPRPKYKPLDAIVGRCHPHSEVIMFDIIDARYDSHYGHWIYRGFHNDESKEMYEWDIIYRFKS